MDKKELLKDKKYSIALVVFIALILAFVILLNKSSYLPEPVKENCNISDGYVWNEEYKSCLKQSEITYCKPEQREGDVCTQQYDPVCGFKYDNSRETFSNNCKACLNEQVDFYVPGECKE